MIVGIDLGTTNSLIAVWKSGEVKVIPNALGKSLTPSVVSVDSHGAFLIGEAALTVWLPTLHPLLRILNAIWDRIDYLN